MNPLYFHPVHLSDFAPAIVYFSEMICSRYVTTAILALSPLVAFAQQLSDAYIPLSYPGLSTSCQDALNTSVSCPAFLSPLSVKYGYPERNTHSND